MSLQMEGRRDTAGQERYHSLAPMYYRCECAMTLHISKLIRLVPETSHAGCEWPFREADVRLVADLVVHSRVLPGICVRAQQSTAVMQANLPRARRPMGQSSVAGAH